MQRVALAVALVTRPPLVLLDEPTSQLDPVAGDELIWLLRRLNEEWGVAVVLAEHRLERCLAAADRVVAMDARQDRLRRPAAGLPRARGRDRSGPGHPGAINVLAGRDRPAAGRGARRPRHPSGPRDRGGAGGRRGEAAASGDTGAQEAEAGAGPAQRALRSRWPDARRRSRRRRNGRALKASGLWVELDPGEGPVDVLRGVDLRVDPGERVALMGRNGAGKSTPAAHRRRTARAGRRADREPVAASPC